MPRSIVNVAVTKRILLSKKKPSLEKSVTSLSSTNFFEFMLYIISPPPIRASNMSKMKIPRVGSLAKE